MNNMQLFGREEIYTEKTVIDETTIPDIINEAIVTHLENRDKCDTLINFYRGEQPILNRTKEIREDIIHNTVVNFANAIVRDKVGYFLSSPMQYTLRNTDKQAEFDEFKKLLSTEEKNSSDFDVATVSSICGHSFMMIISDNQDEAPFEFVSLDPRSTFVVREVKVTHKVLLGVTYYESVSEDGQTPQMIYDVRTADKIYIYKTNSSELGNLSKDNLEDARPISLPVCPIVEYRNNKFMLGDFETVVDLLNAMNDLMSNSLEDIAQFVQSYLVFLNATIDEEAFEKIKENKMFSLVDAEGTRNTDAKFISAQLNPQSVQNLKDAIYKAIMFITATPERMESPGGSPTGQGVSLGYGYPAQEHDAKGKDMQWYKSERDMLRLTLAILHKSGKVQNLNSIDITPLFNRTLFETAQSNAQTAAMMVNSKLWSPKDAVRFASPTSDAEQAIKNAIDFWQLEFGSNKHQAPNDTAT